MTLLSPMAYCASYQLTQCNTYLMTLQLVPRLSG